MKRKLISALGLISVMTISLLGSQINGNMIQDSGFELGYPSQGEGWTDSINTPISSSSPWIRTTGTCDHWAGGPKDRVGYGDWGGLANGLSAVPDEGGSFVACGSWYPPGERITQHVTGATVGKKYTLSFWYANAGVEGSTTANSWVKAGVWVDNTQIGVTEPLSYLGAGNQVWRKATFIYTATSSEFDFTIGLHSTNDYNNRGYVAFDGAKVKIKSPEPQSEKPFECDANSYIFSSDKNATYSKATVVNLINGEGITAKEKFGSYHINAIGFNPKDGYIYGWQSDEGEGDWDRPNAHLIKVDANYNVVEVNLKKDIPDSKQRYILGDVSQDGIYYMANMLGKDDHPGLRKIRTVDLNTKEALNDIVINYNDGDKPLYNADFAINPIDNNLYMINTNNNQLVKIYLGDKAGIYEELGKVYDMNPNYDVETGDNANTYSVFSFFDKDGNFYFQIGKKIYKIDISKPWSTKDDAKAKAKPFTSTDLTTSGDGARCALAGIGERAKLIAEYRFDDCEFKDDESLNVKDSIGDSDATSHNGVSSVEGIINRAAKFNGGDFDNSSYIDNMTPDFNLAGNFSISFVINADDITGDEGVFSKTIDLIVLKDKSVAVDINGLGLNNSSHTIISSGKLSGWSEVTLVSNNGKFSIYIDSKLDTSVEIAEIKNTKNELLIGKVSHDYKSFSGKLDELKFFDGALNEEDIVKLYNNDMIKNVNYDGSTRETMSCPTPFACDSNSYVFTSLQDANYAKAIKINMSEGNTTIAKDSFGDAHINAIGFNPVDGFIYGWDYGEGSNYSSYDPHIVKVDADYNVTRVDVEGDLPEHRFYIGDVSKNGIYYMAYKNGETEQDYGDVQNIYRVDLNSKKTLSVLNVNKNGYTNQIVTADFAINPIDDQIYLVNAVDAHLIKIDKDSGNVSDLGYVGLEGNFITYSVYSFFDKYGNYYFQVNKTTAYKIDISNPWKSQNSTKAEASYFNSFSIDNSGDGARCALAAISDKAILSIEQKIIKVPEGDVNDKDDGTNGVDINITIRSDRELESDVSVIVGQVPDFGNATRGVDYIKQAANKIILPKGMTSKTFKTRSVIADIKSEKNEMFEYLFGVDPDSKNIAIFTNDVVTVKIEIIDDDFSSFTAFDTDEKAQDLRERNIKTKIVGESFTLTLASFNDRDGRQSSVVSFDRNNTKYKIVDSQECQNDINLTGFTRFIIPEQAVEVDQNITVNKAGKDLRVAFRWKNIGSDNWSKSCSKDNFAVRPKEFSFSNGQQISRALKATAGKPYGLSVYAFSGAEQPSNLYNEENGGSFRIDANQTRPDKCSYDSSEFDDSNMTTFVNGTLDGTIKYGDVGKLTIKVSEINGSEFAKVDENDTSWTDRVIASKSIQVEFRPDHFDINVSMDNKHTDSGYAFYSNDVEDSPTWMIQATAKDDENNTLKNFDNTCQAKTVDLDMFLDINASDELVLLSNIEDNTTISKSSSGTTSLKLDSNISSFTEGVGRLGVKFNFKRSSTIPLDPALLNMKQVDLKIIVDENVTGTKVTQVPMKYQYMRAYIQDPIAVIGKKSITTKVYYETYESSSRSVKAKKGKRSKSGERSWHEVKDYDNKSGKMTYDGEHFMYSGTSSHDRLTISKDSNTSVTITATHLPEKNVVVLGVDDDFKTNDSGTIDTHVTFRPDTVNWAGDGDTGMIVDTNVSTRVYKKMNW